MSDFDILCNDTKNKTMDEVRSELQEIANQCLDEVKSFINMKEKYYEYSHE